MKKLAIVIVLVFVFIAIAYQYFFADKLAAQKEIQCDRFKTGEFTFSEKSKIRIVRNDSIQTEFSLTESDEEAFIDKYNIHWINDCTYYLTLRSTNRPEGLDFSMQDTMTVVISATKDYMYEYSAFKQGKTFQGTIIKIK